MTISHLPSPLEPHPVGAFAEEPPRPAASSLGLVGGSARATASESAPTVASLAGVTKRYGETFALRKVDLDVHAGEVVALLGPNGAGKTTAINLLLGLGRPSAGTATLFGADPSRSASRMRTGVMMQISGVPETLTVREHLRLHRSYYAAPRPLEDLLAETGLLEIADRVYGRLSGGQKQRLHLALALSGDPDLLFLDEPTTGLDVRSKRALWEQIRRAIGSGASVLLTTHDLDEADTLADRVVVLQHGRVIADASPATIKRRAANRRIRVATRLDDDCLALLPGVARVRRDGIHAELLSTDAESTVRRLLADDAGATDLTVIDAGLEDAFLDLTGPPQVPPSEAAHV